MRVLRRSPYFELDVSGRVTSGDATETTEQTQTRRTAFVDVRGAADRYAAADRGGRGIGAVSPDLVARGTVGGKLVVATYGSPRVRGRTILGAVVPYGQVWRTGANEATQLIFDNNIMLGGKELPAGAYSLWTVPKADGSVDLIVNSQHGQWGTDYDAGHDLMRMPMKVSTAPTSQEVFEIDITAGNSAALRMSWDRFIWSVPISPAK